MWDIGMGDRGHHRSTFKRERKKSQANLCLLFSLLIVFASLSLIIFWAVVSCRPEFRGGTLSLNLSPSHLSPSSSSPNEAEEGEEDAAFEDLLANAPLGFTVEDAILRHDLKWEKYKEEQGARPLLPSSYSKRCTMTTCFNFERCQNDVKVYVYPQDKFVPISTIYEKILNRIIASPYYTTDPDEACLFVLSIDTMDRDSLSHDFVRNLESRVNNLQYWNHGENHLIFNLYAGTWPEYNETELGFDYGKAILVKASMSLDQYRPSFDISLPLFHPSHSERGDDVGLFVTNEFPTKKKHLIAFKGKRYVYGIGSETRNSIYHLHNGNDIVMVTTCKHGKNWKEMKDERCDEDNREYEKYDYETLLQNSTFCLVPRGRRLGSFRFLEALRSGCIPVLLSNGWVLPFSEVIDWAAATITVDERTLLQTLEMIRSVDHKRIFQMKQQTQVLWSQYLSSMERIMETVFEIMKDRINPFLRRPSHIWNSSPGAINVDMSYGESEDDYPFYHSNYSIRLKANVTAIIRVQHPTFSSKSSSYAGSNLFKLIKTLSKSHIVSKVIVLWSSTKPIPRAWPAIPHLIAVKQITSNSQRFFTDEIETDAIFMLNEDTYLRTDEVDFAYQTWRSFPDRIVGYESRSHHWNEYREQWMYSSKSSNDYSMVLNGAFMYHVYYNHLYWLRLPPAALMVIESLPNCDDIALNLLIARVTKKPPIRLTSHRKYIKDSYSRSSSWTQQERLQERHSCLNELFDVFGSMPLRRSSTRVDPVLFKDPVSNLRKKYRHLEL